MKRAHIAFSICILVGLSATSGRAEDFKAVKKAIHDKISKLESFSYKMHSTQDMNNPSYQSKTVSDAAIEYVRKGGKVLYRTEMNTKMDVKMGDTEQKTDMKMIAVHDGEYTWSYSENNGQKSATKQKGDPAAAMNPFDALTSFKESEKMFAIKALPEEKVDGKACWVLEMMPKDESMKQFTGRTLAYYDKETGISLKIVAHDPQGKVMSTTTMTELKTNPSISPDRFKFTPPAGVEVMEIPAQTATPAKKES
ncbi:MAG TPA: sigma-E factor regulatory protein RseB domain-containing protein [Phycisphaerae bacterium]|nr:sigma-E factor regulatory protein RseB domain-containing protein [Phycisphaerae bacterium]